MSNLCPEDEMQALVTTMQTGAGDDVSTVNALLERYEEDPRLHFLKGSILAGEGKLIEAHGSLLKAVDIAPDFAIARFQLGFFQLTSGESNNALKTWARLDMLPEEHYLKLFVVGLRHLIRDEFQDCIDTLRKGMAVNKENPPLNNDMQLIIEQCQPLISATGSSENEEVDETSATSFFINQYTDKS